jgi:hypothetical protein
MKMKNHLKALSVLCISTLLFLFSCSKKEDEPTITTRYRLTLKAAMPSSGNTVFSSINYKKADGTTVSLTNTSSSFLESFDISSGFNILFNVSGTNNATNQPSVSINYTVEKFENDVNKGVVCLGSSVTVGGSAGSWSFNATNNSTFDGTSCQ